MKFQKVYTRFPQYKYVNNNGNVPIPLQQNHMATTMKLDLCAIICIAFFLSISFTRFQGTKAAGFSIDLIHRDSLQSPSLLSASQRVTKALLRSFNRNNALAQGYDASKPTSAEIVSDRGEYLMKFSLGTPPVETLAIADTGSDLIWIQCKPCIECFQQTAPIFNPESSSTYKQLACDSGDCQAFQKTSCDTSKKCEYTVMYGDRSFSKGEVAKETIALGPTTIQNVTIGCGHMEHGTFGAGASGIVGLGGGKVSLIKQMGSSIKGKFSYCLVPYSAEANPSKMNFGDKADVSGDGAVSTPITLGIPETFYYLTLEGVTVGEQHMEFYNPLTSYTLSSSSKDDQEGNIIIDSGTTLTFLPIEFYYQIITAVKSQIKSERVTDPLGLLRLCYLDKGDIEAPDITFHFKGADVTLKPVNTFVKTSQLSLCLAFAPASSVAIYGNLAQLDFLVGYDLEKKTVSFKPTDCNKAS